MTKMFAINGKSYKAKEFDFNLLCDLEDQGLSLDDIDKKPMSLVRTYLSFCAGITKEMAGKEIEAHLESGGKFNDVVETMSEMMKESGFFRAISKGKEEDTRKTSAPSAKTKKA